MLHVNWGGHYLQKTFLWFYISKPAMHQILLRFGISLNSPSSIFLFCLQLEKVLCFYGTTWRIQDNIRISKFIHNLKYICKVPFVMQSNTVYRFQGLECENRWDFLFCLSHHLSSLHFFVLWLHKFLHEEHEH